LGTLAKVGTRGHTGWPRIGRGAECSQREKSAKCRKAVLREHVGEHGNTGERRQAQGSVGKIRRLWVSAREGRHCMFHSPKTVKFSSAGERAGISVST